MAKSRIKDKQYEMVLHIAEQWQDGKGFSYFAIVWGKYLTLDVPLAEEQVIEVVEEIPNSLYIKDGFRRRDYFATCLVTYEQMRSIIEYK